jgi:hypothetical protein
MRYRLLRQRADAAYGLEFSEAKPSGKDTEIRKQPL